MKKILSFSLILILSQIFCAQSQRPLNTRMFEPTIGLYYPGFIKHSNENPSETYYSAYSTTGGFRTNKYKSDGILKWSTSVYDADFTDLSLTRHNISVDNNDAVIFNVHPSIGTNCSFTDSEGIVEILANDKPSILKVDKNGKLLFKKTLDFVSFLNLRTSVYTDSENNIYVLGQNEVTSKSFYILKLNGTTGEQIFLKNYENIGVYNAFLVFDSTNNFYVFLDCFTTEASLIFDSIIIPRGSATTNVMVKFDQNGTALFGKNFYENGGGSNNSSVLSDGIFDGTNIIVSGYLAGNYNGSFEGLNNLLIPRKYPNTRYQGLIAKIDLQGAVIWQKPIHSSVDLIKGMWTNISVDSEKNIYSYFQFKDKINYDNTEIQFDAIDGNSVVSKFNSNGENLYFNSVTSGKVLNNFTTKTMDLIGVDTYNINGTTMDNKFLEYPLINQNYAKSYIATFGTLSKKYLTPENNYLELTTTTIPNNPAPTVNEFSFSLVNNVNWTATSDQSWLNLSSISLTSKSPQQTINGNGDAKITLFADQNTTGISRSSNVIISGENVASKTIIVSQGATLGTSNNALSIITLYPNPTSNFLNIKSSQKISKVGIYDMSGKLVKSANLIDENINVESLLKGNYLIKLYTENGVVTSKFIKN